MIPRTPYVLAVPAFRFRALAGVAERLPLGGEREVALATFVAARLVADAAAATEDTPGQIERATGARHWFMTQALPAPTRSALLQLVDAVQRGDSLALAAAWERVVTLAGKVLDAASKAELRAIALRPAHRERGARD